MELVLVRHAQPEWARNGLAVSNPPLTDHGHNQAALLAKRLAHESFDAVLVSPLIRARQTAEPILDVLGVEPTIEPWLEEIRVPDWTGTPSAEVDERFKRALGRPVDQLWNGLVDGGEPFRDFHRRITEGVNTALAPHGVLPNKNNPPLWDIADPSTRVLVVAHAGTNATIIGHMLGIQPLPWEWERFVMFHASFSVLRPLRIGNAWSFSLFRLGDAEHIADDDRTR